MSRHALAAAMMVGPVLAVEDRNGRAQAAHTGSVVVLGKDGAARLAWGIPSQATYWRSAAKPLQALPFAACAHRFGLGLEEIAVACGSHQAEGFHVRAAGSILKAAGLAASELQCGIHDPGPQAGAMPSGGWTALHNNCSGKHAGMLAACVANGWPRQGYLDPSHPLQQAIAALAGRSAGMLEVKAGVDGCGLPTYWGDLEQLARAYQWLGTSPTPEAARVLQAMATHPEMVGGTRNADTDIVRATGGRVLSKYGAAGVVAALHRGTGEALAVKMDAGNALAARAVALAAMRSAGWLSGPEAAAVADHLRPPIRNHAGLLVGHLETRLHA